MSNFKNHLRISPLRAYEVMESMKKAIKKLILGMVVFVASLGLLPTLTSFATDAPSVDASATCEVLSVDLKKFPASQPAQSEQTHVEYLWQKTETSKTHNSTAPSGGGWILLGTEWHNGPGHYDYNWQRIIGEWDENRPAGSGWVQTAQQRTVVDQEAQPAKNNTIKVTIDAAVVEDTTFSTSFSNEYTLGDQYAVHNYVVEAVAWDNPNYTFNVSGASVPCDNGEVKKVAFCHATASVTNPYTYNDTSVNAFFNAGHHEHQNYEDIVPPFTYVKQGKTIEFEGLNWNAQGQAIFANDCNVPVTKEAAFSVTTEPATCEAGEKLVYTTSQNVVVSGTSDGTYGEGTYEVTADAVAGAEFSNGKKSLTVEGTLAGKLSDEDCIADAELSFTPATCQVGQMVEVGALTNATLTSAPEAFTGAGSYSFEFAATGVATFQGDAPTLTLAGELAGPLNTEECDDPEVLVATAAVQVVPATCEVGDVLQYDAGDAVNALFDEASTPSDSEGVQSYEVIAIANEGAAFSAGEGVSEDGSTLTFTGELAGPLTGDDCVLSETPETPETPEKPTVLPNTSAGDLSIIAISASALLALLGGIVLRRFLSRGL